MRGPWGWQRNLLWLMGFRIPGGGGGREMTCRNRFWRRLPMLVELPASIHLWHSTALPSALACEAIRVQLRDAPCCWSCSACWATWLATGPAIRAARRLRGSGNHRHHGDTGGISAPTGQSLAYAMSPRSWCDGRLPANGRGRTRSADPRACPSAIHPCRAPSRSVLAMKMTAREAPEAPWVTLRFWTNVTVCW